MTRAYCIKFLIATSLVFFGTALFNLIVDPYSIWGSPAIHGLNTSKYSVFHERIQNYAAWSHWPKPPGTILLGTSRTADGLRSNHRAFQNDTSYNMALGGQPISETLLLFKHAQKSGKLKKTVIGLDFFAFNAYWAADSADQAKRLTPGLNLDLLFNSGTLSDSFTTLRQSWPALEIVRAAHGAKTHSSSHASPSSGILPMRVLFTEVEKIYVDYHRPYPYRIYSYSNAKTGNNTLNDFRELLKIAYANNIELHLLISPSHAWHWEGLANVGLWQHWEQWKLTLTRINAEEAEKSGKPLYPLWDFSGYNSITTETVPATHSADKMKWYSDSSHYNRACGDMILDRVFDLSDASVPIPDDFGIRIDEYNITTHLTDIRQAREHYAETHPSDVQEMAKLIKQFWNH